MVERNKYLHGVWQGPWYFIGATVCASAGLGALWYFPAAVSGSDASLVTLFYALFLVLLAWPLLLAESVLGRRGRQSPVNTMRYLVMESQLSPAWRAIGVVATLSGVLMVSWFALLAIWAGDYFWDMTSGVMQGQNLRFAIEHFNEVREQPQQALLRCGLFLLLVAMVSMGGVRRIGRVLRHLVALLIWLLVLAAVLSVVNGNWLAGYYHLFDLPHVSLATGQWLASAATALSMALLTCALGVGAASAFGAYLPERSRLAKSTLLVVLVVGLFAYTVALTIHATVLAEPARAVMEGQSMDGLNMLFVALPISFSNTAYGLFLGGLFFLFIALACWGSAIALLEPAIAWLVESTRCNRFFASLLVGLICLGLMPTSFYTLDRGGYGIVEQLCGYLLPLVGLLVTLFVGWRLPRNVLREALFDEPRILFSIWYGLLRYVLPILMIIMLGHSIYRHLIN
ncbi:hypothetical protein KFE80_06605 [bacterium SCSIO 12696]|nr:hypothetical protein KFE80_06605 [bacterium SCSIO 12696]